MNNKIKNVREEFLWGRNYDRDRNLLAETQWIKLKNISDEHLNALIEEDSVKSFRHFFKEEKQYRIKHAIKVPDYE